MNEERKYAVLSLCRYWSRNQDTIVQLPMPERILPSTESLPPEMTEIPLPDWAYDIGVNEKLLLPAWTIIPGEQPAWQRADWLSAMFWYLNGSAERAYEKLHGPVLSYSLRLKGWDKRLWERAWVNRIALFLRRWAARIQNKEEEELFGPLPEPEVIFTHDVDAIQKTLTIRFKQSTFHVWNIVRSFLQGKGSRTREKMTRAVRFLTNTDDYWCFDRITALEEKYGVRSHFNVYGGTGGWRRTLKQRLIDPDYDILHPLLNRQLRCLHQNGWTIGLHQSYNAWTDAELVRTEKARLEQALDIPVTTCRQHWLRFSWEHTWQAQQEASFELDTTLGFNDHSGFRNGAALCFSPWNARAGKAMKLKALPMVLMDSHLYDYGDLGENERYQQINYWLDEIRAVRGVATVVWHQRVMSEDYGWGPGYEYLLSQIKGELC